MAKDLASKLKLLDASQRLVDAQSRLATNLGEQQKLKEQIAGAEADRDGFVGEWQRKLAEDMAQTRSDRDATAARLSKAQLRHELDVMTAPARRDRARGGAAAGGLGAAGSRDADAARAEPTRRCSSRCRSTPATWRGCVSAIR